MARDLGEIIEASSSFIESLVEEAFEAGREQGRLEAGRELKSKINRLLSDGQDDVASTPPEETVEQSRPVVTPERMMELVEKNEKRASPGSVKPAVLQLVQNAKTGISQEEIAQRTGFKFNSVRGTLWTLGNENAVERRGTLWFAKSAKPGFVDVFTAELPDVPHGSSEPKGNHQHGKPSQSYRTLSNNEEIQNTEAAERVSGQEPSATSVEAGNITE